MAGTEGETLEGVVPATGSRRALAGVLDVALAAVPAVISMRRAMGKGRDSGEAVRRMRWLAAVGPLKAILDEQVGSPGGWVAGIRTVDSRTGRRVALWRTLLLASARLGLHQAARRARGPDRDLEAHHAEMGRQVREIAERFPDDEEARNAALMAHYREQNRPASVNLLRPMAITLVTVLVNRVLRRRLAPTMLVERPRGAPRPERGSDQSP